MSFNVKVLTTPIRFPSIVALPAADLAIVVSLAWPNSIVPTGTATVVLAAKFVAVATLPAVVDALAHFNPPVADESATST